MTDKKSGAGAVARGILLSRIAGFVRDRAIAHFFGVGPHSDVFRTALRGPNILQNLLGEGTISASFIPVYSRLLGEGREEDAGRFAGAVFGLLLAAAGALSLIGVLFARPIVAVLAAGYLGDAAAIAAGTADVDRYELTVTAVRIVFPMTGILVLAAWALGVLNSHRRFFLPYCAPVLWNAAIVAALVVGASSFTANGSTTDLNQLLIAACIGALIGGVLQFAVQLPLVARVMRGFKFSLSTKVVGVRQALTAFAPVVAARGVVQVSAYLDLFLASLLAPGAVAALGWAQALYMLPISLFGLSVAAAELPELSRAGSEANSAELAGRINTSLRQMLFVNVPTCIGYLLLGYLIVGALYRTGRFSTAENWLVYLVLCGYSLGLLAATSSRLLQSAFYAVGDTATPSRIAVQRVVTSAVLGAGLMLWLDRFGLDVIPGATSEPSALKLGAIGLAAAAGCASWLELVLLWSKLKRRMPEVAAPLPLVIKLISLALLAVLPAASLWRVLPPLHVALTTLVVVGCYATCYLVAARAMGISEATLWMGRFLGRRGRG